MIQKAGSSNVLPRSQTGSWTQWAKWCEWVWMMGRRIHSNVSGTERRVCTVIHRSKRPGITGRETCGSSEPRRERSLAASGKSNRCQRYGVAPVSKYRAAFGYKTKSTLLKGMIILPKHWSANGQSAVFIHVSWKHSETLDETLSEKILVSTHHGLPNLYHSGICWSWLPLLTHLPCKGRTAWSKS